MPEKVYESEKVRLTWSRRWRDAASCAIFVLIGLALLGIAASMKPDSDIRGVVVMWGLVIGGVGAFYALYAITKTHTIVLTARGNAEKAADEAALKRLRQAQKAKLNAWELGLSVGACVIVVVVFCYGPIVDRMNGRITVYPLYCSSWSTTTTDQCLSDEQVMAETTYTVRVDQQLVVGINVDTKDPLKLYDCVVVDTQNWSCASSLGPGATNLKMHDGKFSFDPIVGTLAGYHSTSRVNYFFEKLAH